MGDTMTQNAGILDAAGWIAGIGFTLATVLLLGRGLRRRGAASLGAGNAVTLARSLVVGAATVLAVRSGATPALAAVAAVALALDGVDGPVARRTGSASELGARFDMEVDAFLLLVLSAVLVPTVGPWVLAIGALRYVFAAAGVLLPWLTAPLCPRFSRKVVAATQGVVLVGAVSGLAPSGVTVAALLAALAVLCWSFARDVAGLTVSRPLGSGAASRRPRGTGPGRRPSARPEHSAPA
jgi:phosphatidylglycerophosphate synthase